MVPANGAALAVAVVAVAFAAAEECADSCGVIDGNHAKTMNTLACKGLSNYPHKELDACRKGFKVAHTMAVTPRTLRCTATLGVHRPTPAVHRWRTRSDTVESCRIQHIFTSRGLLAYE